MKVDPTTIKVPELVLGPETSPGAGDGLPTYTYHGWRYLTGNPATGELAIAIGAPCNVPWTGSSDPGIERGSCCGRNCCARWCRGLAK